MRFKAALAALVASALVLTGCGNGAGSDDVTKIGGVTIVSHPSLDAIWAGFKDGMKEAGYEEGKNVSYDFQNPQGDQSTLNSIASTFANSDNDLFVAIATPPAQALANAITDKPVIFSGVTDPVAAGLVKSLDAPGANVTGASDANPPKAVLELIKEIKPTAKTIGIVYTSSEVNSEVQTKQAQEAAKELGLEVKVATVTNSNEVQQAAASLDVDAFYVGNDNNVVSALEALIQEAEKKKAIVVTSDEDSVSRGATAAISIDYYQQGKDTAKLAVQILKDGMKPADLPVSFQQKLKLVVNPAAATKQGTDIPQAVLDKADKKVG
ncbi:ABC transporter substrate-binding protein [Propionibacteriaceae bacterium G57]|uniref:ABC transporter substrate-binding protein n=1 Tax=Aestuariimicrobium sp. G57 TaxID=3418485 RepID=UPI003DA6E269